MNQVARYSAHSITPQVASKHIASLFVGLQSQNKGPLTDALAAAYVEAVKDIPEFALTEAVSKYRKGHLGHGRFVPSPAELAQSAREIVSREAKFQRDREDLARQKRMIDSWRKARANVTDESRARVAAMHEKAKREIATAKLANELHEKANPKIATIKDTHNRFKDQARQELIKLMEGDNA